MMIQRKILVIDDEINIFNSIKRVLRKENYILLHAENGEEGMRLLKEEKPILVLLDIMMPIMDGITFLEKINITPESDFSVIILTGLQDSNKIEQCYNLGAANFMSKDFNPFILKGMINNLVNMKKTENDLKFKNKLEFLTSEVSSSFIDIHYASIHVEIEKALNKISEFLNVDKGYFVITDEDRRLNRRFVWSENDRDSIYADKFYLNKYSWSFETLSRNEIIRKDLITDLPDEAIEEIEAFNKDEVVSFINIPVSYMGNTVGILGFESVKHKRVWKKDSVQMLKAVGEIFYSAILRKTNEEEKEKLNEKLLRAKEKEAINAMTITANHEINQPLTIISGAVQLASIKFNDNQELMKYFDRIQKGVDQINSILEKLREIKEPVYVKYADKIRMISLENFDKEVGDEC